MLLTGVLSSESAVIDILYQNDTQFSDASYIVNESLPQPLPQTAAQPRNYVAYIPVPISDEDDEDEDDEYYDDDEDYYEDEYDEDEDEYYYEEEEEEEKKPPPRRKRPSHKRKRPNRRVYNNDRGVDDGNNERVPFLVPLMMVPESEIGMDKKFSFSGDQMGPPKNQPQRPNQDRRIPGQRINNRPFSRPNCKSPMFKKNQINATEL